MRKSLVLITLAAAVLAGCGGGGGAAKLGSSDVAVVGKTHISTGSLTALLARAQNSYKAQGQKFPKPGTTDYETLKSQAVSLLIQQAELEDKAKQMEITVTSADIDTRLALIKKQYYGGSQKKYLADIKKQGYTDQQIRDEVIQPTLISEKIQSSVTKDVKVTDAEIQTYYNQHKSQYEQPETRQVRYILVGKSKTTADSVYQQLVKGTDKTWCTLAKKYAKDSSGQTCGKATFSKGQTVAVFDKAAFSAPVGKVVKPFYDKTQYKAWFVIEPLGKVKPKSVTPEKQVAATIKQTLQANKNKAAVNAWQAALTKHYCGSSNIKYAVGYSAAPDPCAATTTSSTTTTG
jgi:hypothetical protein